MGQMMAGGRFLGEEPRAELSLTAPGRGEERKDQNWRRMEILGALTAWQEHGALPKGTVSFSF